MFPIQSEKKQDAASLTAEVHTASRLLVSCLYCCVKILNNLIKILLIMVSLACICYITFDIIPSIEYLCMEARKK